MDYQYIRYTKKGRIGYVTINRPEVMNALHPPALAELNSAWADVIADDEIWVAILTGAGERAFSAGADLKYRVEQAEAQAPSGPGRHVGHVLDTCPKPVIAAVNGYAVGGGLEMALRCDIIIAAEHARMGLPEPRRGLLADSGGAIRLPRRVPYHQAMALILTGRLISASETFRLGLVNEVVTLAELMPTAERWANEILECAPLAVQAAKQVVKDTLDMPAEVAVGLTDKLATVRRLRESDDYVEGPRAFVEKRKPLWKGY